MAPELFKIFYLIAHLTPLALSSALGLPEEDGQIYEFCANNQLFSFSAKACPGGVLLKEPLELTEPCHCINQQLTIYTDCDVGRNGESAFPRKVCHRHGWKERVQVMERHILIKLLHPNKRSWQLRSSTSPFLRFKCGSQLESCTRNPSNTALSTLHANDTRSDSDFDGNSSKRLMENDRLSWNGVSPPQNDLQHQHHRQKRDMSISHVTDERLQARIQDTIKCLNRLQIGDGDEGEVVMPKSMSLQMLSKSVEIFNHITPNLIVTDETVNSILTLFLEKYSDLEVPDPSGNPAVDELLDRYTFDQVMIKLGECSSKARDHSQEFQFTSAGENTCPPQITHSIYKVQTVNYGIKRFKFELGGFMLQDRKYIPEREDFVLGFLWKIFDAVYSYCFPHMFTFQSAQIFVKYHNIMENIFSHPMVIKDFLSEHGQGTFMYSTRISHENLTLLMQYVDYMDEAVHFVSKYKNFFRKPKLISPISFPATESQTGTILNDNFSNRRRKRSSQSYSNWEDIEIWEGQAYCLQLANPNLPPSLANAYPNIENLCAD